MPQFDKWFREILATGRQLLSLTSFQFKATSYVNTWATALTDGATITPVLTDGNRFTFTAANNNVRAFQAPANPVSGDSIKLRIVNTSGGALTNTTFAAAIKQPAAVTYPATGFNRTYTLEYDGTTWSLVTLSSADCAN